MTDVLDFLTKKELKKLSKVDFETRKIFEDLTGRILHSFAMEFERLETRYLQEKQDMMVVAVAFTLNQAYGFGKKRLPEVFSDIWETYTMLDDEDLSMKECVDTLKEHNIIVETQTLECQNLFKDLKGEE